MRKAAAKVRNKARNSRTAPVEKNTITRASRFSSEALAPKQRLMIPARVALALQADGWWLRDEIIWAKPNPMPVSVTDRTTPAHEMLYVFSKSARYHYDMESVKEPAVTKDMRRPYAPGQVDSRGNGHARGGGTGNRTYTGFNERWDATEPATLRQPRSVWSIATRPFKGAHFATFPPDLVRPCIKAGCPLGGTVLDPFGGAGTTALVAAELGRSAIMVELNPAYAALASERLGLRALTPEGDILGRVLPEAVAA